MAALQKYSIYELERIIKGKKDEIARKVLRFVTSGKIKDVDKGEYIEVDRRFFIEHLGINCTLNEFKIALRDDKFGAQEIEAIYTKLVNSKNIYI